MSEEILKALMQLFALIVKQDGGVQENEKQYVLNFLTQQLNAEAVKEYLTLFENFAGIGDFQTRTTEQQPTSVKDSVRIFGICKKINRTLTQKQKLVVLVRLFELINADRKFTNQRMTIINTVAEVFNISRKEFTDVENFIKYDQIENLDYPNIMVISNNAYECKYCKQTQPLAFSRNIFILQIKSVDLYFLKHDAKEEIFLNGLLIRQSRVYLLAPGSSLRFSKGQPIYYSDIVSKFLADTTTIKISYVVNNINYQFPSGGMGVQDISFSEKQGKLISIMGASGTGKTTLLNILSGIQKPTSGEIRINGVDLYKDKDALKGVIGLIPQDDLLIEELTVFENLYFNAKLCFKNKSENEIIELVNKTLTNLDLYEKKDLRVGAPLNKIISGGQRKRLNIALELIREPSILFVDEPTSGLSSRDSENVMDLLRELTLKGKLIFAVIHQPSSDIFKMFDNVVILDTGGYMVYYGNPVEAVIYFKTMDAQINREIGECPVCGSVNPEIIFNILDSKVVDEFGKYTNKRKVAPSKWQEHFIKEIKLNTIHHEIEAPPSNLNIPSRIKQFTLYTIRDFLSKISNTQYVLLTLLEAPILAFILSFIIRYIADPNSSIYIFRENENIPIYIFMSLIVALFLGLTVSAEEIFRDRKILEHEKFLNLSRTSYLLAKITILLLISAIQSFLFVIIGNSILGIKSMNMAYLLALFTTSAFANLLGLNISSSFNSAITIYIIIPLLIIPMMVLSGAMFSFDKLNRNIGSVDKVPLVAELMATKWTYEALMVHQFKKNEYEKLFYDLEKKISIADFKMVRTLPKLHDALNQVIYAFNNNNLTPENESKLPLLRNEIIKENKSVEEVRFEDLDKLIPESFDIEVAQTTRDYLRSLESHYNRMFQEADREIDNRKNYYMENKPNEYWALYDTYFNERVSEIVRKIFEKEKNKIIEYKNELIQKFEPIYQDPIPKALFTVRTHFFAPQKGFFGKLYDTYSVNILIVWIMSGILYLTLYFDLLKKIIELFEKIKLKRKI
jgi:ABC-type multidrug transport system ATPase subunit/uncharacterized tellurite resistance protein B-like protein